MRNSFLVLIGLLWVTACSTTSPNRLVYSSGFSFANYDYVVIAKPDGSNTHTSLYGMDVEFANLMGRYNMKVIGPNEYTSLSDSNRLRTLFARMAATAGDDYITLSVSFDDAVSGRTARVSLDPRKVTSSTMVIGMKFLNQYLKRSFEH